uniref:Hook C-terminal domain-containing protein n=1 Tax=Fibrocapsa japonica TaxID=94617 RepID=A0A7S2UWL2_9STRA
MQDAAEHAAEEAGGGGLDSFESSSDLREKVARLQRENKELQKALGGGEGADSDRFAILETQLDDANRMIKQREEAAMEANRKCSSLESEMRDLKKHIDGLETAAQTKNSSGGDGAAAGEARVDESRVKALDMTVAQLTQQLKERESKINRLTSDKEKLEAYTKKTLHKVQEKYLTALQTCKNQLSENQEKIKHLENSRAKDKQTQKLEERLLMSAMYNMGMDMVEHKLVHTVTSRGGGGSISGANTWLSRGREEAKNKVTPQI